MSTVAAISISDKEALVVTGDQDKDGVIQLISITSRTLTGTHSSPERTGEQGTNGMAAQTSGAEVSSSAEAAFIMKETATSSSSTLIDLGVDSIVALAPAIKVLYKKSFLPFSDQKKLDQVLPLQIQDALPFDVGEFVVANVVLAKNGNNNYEILSSIAPRSDIERTLRIMSALGAEPHILTTRASMLASLASISREPLGSTYVLIALSEEYCSIALFVEDHLCQLRDLPIPDQPGTGETANGELLAMIKSSVIAAEHEFSIRFPVVYLIGNREAAHVLSEVLFIPVKLFPIERAVRNQTGEHLDFSAIFWAVGAIASENSKAKDPAKRPVDFRKGIFAYQPAWGNLWFALRDELLPICLAVFFLVGWAVALVYHSNKSLKAIDDKIHEIVSTAIPDEEIPRGTEFSELEDRIQKIEDQLRGIGSLSSLSPLETLRELSQTISPEVKIEIDTLSIGHSRLIFRGSVPDNPAAGALEEMLKQRKERFCSVNITPMGQGRGARVNISAEIGICE